MLKDSKEELEAKRERQRKRAENEALEAIRRKRRERKKSVSKLKGAKTEVVQKTASVTDVKALQQKLKDLDMSESSNEEVHIFISFFSYFFSHKC